MGWKETLDPYDINWIAHSLFATKGVLVFKLKTWWFPPEIPGPHENRIPLVSDYFQRRLFLWMPRKMWASEFKCPCCPIVYSLTSKGLYNRVRSVIDLKNRYYLATEYLECSSCKGTFLSYDYRLLQQLPDDVKARFPVVLPRRSQENFKEKLLIPFLGVRTSAMSVEKSSCQFLRRRRA